MYDCELCGNAGGCLFTVRECVHYYIPATKYQLIERLETGLFSRFRDNMIQFLKSEYGIIYQGWTDDCDEAYLQDT